MKTKVCKRLAQRLIRESKAKELGFEPCQLEAIKKSAEVTYYEKEDGWSLYVMSQYGESCGGGYYWRGWFKWNEKEQKGTMNVFSGFSGNLISQVERNYDCTRPHGTDYKQEFETILTYMKKARAGSIANVNCYRDYVMATGDMS